MKQIILDASAVLAFINKEPGHEKVEPYLPYSIISTINLAEVMSILLENHLEEKEVKNLVGYLIHEIVPFGEEHAFMTAALKKSTQAHGLSLGDRACLALAKIKNLPVLTADKAWQKLNLKIKTIFIR